jgi:hypothetical protein
MVCPFLDYSLGDMQLAAEFVAYAIKYLAPKSTASGGKINIVSYSQGGPNVSKNKLFQSYPVFSGELRILIPWWLL